MTFQTAVQVVYFDHVWPQALHAIQRLVRASTLAPRADRAFDSMQHPKVFSHRASLIRKERDNSQPQAPDCVDDQNQRGVYSGSIRR
jgi:hypothetical protein